MEGLAEESTEKFLEPVRVTQLTCIDDDNSANMDPVELRNYSWRKHGQGRTMFP
jgi:hypothetical protein